MPTYGSTDRFKKDLAALSADERRRFRSAVERFVADLRSEGGFRPGLRVKGIQGAQGIFEMTWANDGRATFEYGEEQAPGEPHIVWRRVGTHDIFESP